MKMPMSVVGRKVEIRHLISANAGGSDDYETCAAASTTTLPRLHPERGSEVPSPMSVCAPPKTKPPTCFRRWAALSLDRRWRERPKSVANDPRKSATGSGSGSGRLVVEIVGGVTEVSLHVRYGGSADLGRPPIKQMLSR